MIGHDIEDILKSPPVSLTRLATVSRNMGALPTHELLAFILGHNVNPDEISKLQQVFNRAPASLIEAAAADLDVPIQNVLVRAGEVGVSIPAYEDRSNG